MSSILTNYGSLVLSNLGIRKAIESDYATQRQRFVNGIGGGFLSGYVQAPVFLSWEKIRIAKKAEILPAKTDLKTVKYLLERLWPTIREEMPAYQCKTGLKGSAVGLGLFVLSEAYQKYLKGC